MPDNRPKGGGVSLLITIAAAMVGLVFLTAGIFGLLLAGHDAMYLDLHAEDELTRATAMLERRVDTLIVQGRSALNLAHAWIRDGILPTDLAQSTAEFVGYAEGSRPGADATLDALAAHTGERFVTTLTALKPLLESNPSISEVGVLDSKGNAIVLSKKDGATLHLHVAARGGMDQAEAALDGAWLRDFGEIMDDAPAIAETNWYSAALERMRGRPDKNLSEDPDTAWTMDEDGVLVGCFTMSPSSSEVLAVYVNLESHTLIKTTDASPDAMLLVSDVRGQGLESHDTDVLQSGRERWQGDPQLRERVFPSPDGTWQIRFQELPLSGGTLHLGAAIRTDDLMAGTRSLRDGLIVLTVLLTILALCLATLLAMTIRRPIRVFIKQSLKLDPFRGGTTTWPSSRLREMRELANAFDLLSQEARDLQLRALERSAPAQQPQPEPPEPDTEESNTSEPVPSLPEPQVEEVPVRAAEPAGQASSVGPSPMFMQALQSARRGLRAAREENEALIADAARVETSLAQREESIAALADALAQIRAATDINEQLNVVAGALSLAQVGLWTLGDGGEQLLRVHSSDDAARRADIHHDAAPLFFAALRDEDRIAIANGTEDPRAAGFSETATALYICRIPEEACAGYLIAESTDGPRHWRPEEALFLLAVATSLDHTDGNTSEKAESSQDGLQEFERAFSAAETTPFPDSEGERYRWLIESADMVFFATDTTGRVTYANPSAERALDGVAERWLGKPLHDCIPGDSVAVDTAIKDTVAGSAARVIEGHRGSGGRWRFAIAPMCDEDGEVNGTTVCGVMLPPAEVTETPVASPPSEAARIAALPAGVLWSVDTIGCLTYVAPSVSALYGYAPQELKGRPLTALSGEDQGQRDLDQLSRLMEGAPCRGYVTQHRCKDGELLEVLVYGAVLTDSEGQVQGAAGVVVPAPKQDDNE